MYITVGMALGVLAGNTVIHGMLGNWTKGMAIGVIAAILVLVFGPLVLK